MGWDAERVSISGVSAGGNLALGVLEQARRAGDPPLQAAALIVPFVDAAAPPEQYTSPLPPVDAQRHPPFVSRRLVRVSQSAYFADASRRAEPLASPLRNDDGLGALPPLLVVTAERDSVRVHDEHFVHKARARGVPVTYHCARDVDHGFPQSDAPSDQPAVRRLAELLRDHLTEHLASVHRPASGHEHHLTQRTPATSAAEPEGAP
jgi:acetyl esterase